MKIGLTLARDIAAAATMDFHCPFGFLGHGEKEEEEGEGHERYYVQPRETE